MMRLMSVTAILAVVGLTLTAFAAQPGQKAPPSLTGQIVSVDTVAGNVVVQPEHGTQVTVATNANTVVKLQGKASSLDKLAAGLFVTVKPGTGTATEIDAKIVPLSGKIVSVDTTAGKVVVQPEHGAQVTVATDAGTVVKLDGKASSLDKLTAEMLVTVKPSTGTATEIDARTPPLAGRIVSVDTTAGNAVVQPEHGVQVTVATDAKTVFKLQGKVSSLGKLKAGMLVTVKPSTGTAKEIDAKTPTPVVGKIVSVDTTAGNVVVQPQHGAQVTVATDANTVVKLEGNVSTLNKLTAGMPVSVTPDTGTATEIDAKTPPPPPPPHRK